MTFQEKLVVLRKLKGLTQDDFASAVGVSRQAVYKWESGQSYPEVKTLLEIKMLFNVSIDDLLDDNFVIALPEKKRRKRMSKEMKRQIEELVEKQERGEANGASINTLIKNTEKAPKAAVAAKVEEPKAAPAPKAVVVEEPAPKKEEPKVEEPAAEENSKRGLFGRLFGKK